MPFSFGSFSVCLLIFFSQGMVFSLLLLQKSVSQANKSNRWLSLFSFLCSMYIAPFMLGYANWYAHDFYRDVLFFIPFQQVLLIGPVLFFYTQSLLNKSFKLTNADYLHFLPAIIYLAYSLVVFVGDNFIFDEYYFYADGRDKDLSPWYQISGLISMLIYLILSLRYYSLYKKLVYQVVSYADSLLFNWIKRYLIAFLVILFLRVVFLLLYPEWGDFGNKFWYYFFFSVAFLYIALNGYATSVQASIPFHASFFDQEAEYLIPEKKKDLLKNFAPEKNVPNTKEEIPDLELWQSKLLSLMKDEHLYENSKLTLSHLAERLQSNPKFISRIINQGFKMNFNDFINDHRVEAVIRKMMSGEHHEKTLLAIAIECGFNSKATFNRAFKKNTSQTPKKYLTTISQK